MKMSDQPTHTKTRDIEKKHFVEATAEHQVKHNHLLAIAVDYYDDDEIPNLSNCINDIEDLIEVLSNDYFFNKENIHFLRSRYKSADENAQKLIEAKEKGFAFIGEATHENIIAQLRHLAEHITPNDNLVICYSGHGIYDQVFNEGYWIPSDGKLGSNATYIENGTIRTALNAIKSHHTVLISDSCYSGSLFSTGKQRAVGVPKVYQHPSRWALTAGRKNQTVSDGEMGENSPFAKELLSILKRKKEVWIGDLCKSIVEAIEKEESQTPMGEPLANLNGHDGGQFVFLPRLASEIDHWKIAWRENTRKGYYSFLSRYPDGEYEEIALAALKAFAANNKPASSEDLIDTYDFLAENMPVYAKKFILLNVSAKRIKYVPLNEQAKETYFYLNENISKALAVGYVRKTINNKTKSVISEEAKNSFNYLKIHLPDAAAKYIQNFVIKKNHPTINEAAKETYNYLSEHLPAEATPYLNKFVRGLPWASLDNPAKDTYNYLLKHLPEEATSYLKSFIEKKTSATINKSTSNTYNYLLEQEKEEATPYLKNYVFGETTATLNKSVEDTYNYLLKHIPAEAAPYLNAHLAGKKLVAINKTAAKNYEYLHEHLQAEAISYLKNYLYRQTSLTINKEHKNTYNYLLENRKPEATPYLKNLAEITNSRFKLSKNEMDLYCYLLANEPELASPYLDAYLGNKRKLKMNPDLVNAYLHLNAHIPDAAFPYIKSFLAGRAKNILSELEEDTYRHLSEHLPEAASAYLKTFFQDSSMRKINNKMTDTYNYLLEHTPEIAAVYFKTLSNFGEYFLLTEEIKKSVHLYETTLKETTSRLEKTGIINYFRYGFKQNLKPKPPLPKNTIAPEWIRG